MAEQKESTTEVTKKESKPDIKQMESKEEVKQKKEAENGDLIKNVLHNTIDRL